MYNINIKTGHNYEVYVSTFLYNYFFVISIQEVAQHQTSLWVDMQSKPIGMQVCQPVRKCVNQYTSVSAGMQACQLVPKFVSRYAILSADMQVRRLLCKLAGRYAS